jgi:Kef-type K+ transport system membrane component KefB
LQHPFLLVGIIIVLGFIGARLSDFIRIPWVVGYILIGVILGTSGFNLITLKLVGKLEIISIFALALIGFTIGGELEIRELKELGLSIVIITIFEALLAFLFVFISLFLITKNLPLALIFGALASATAPAATVDVLWQYHSRGPLTTTLFGVVGLDDAAALIIYAFASSLAKVFIGSKGFSFFSALGEPLAEIGGSLLLGALAGAILNYTLKFIKDEGQVLIITLGAIILCSGVANLYNLSLILTNMALGFTLINFSRENKIAFERVATINPPVFLMFFILVGARLQIKLLPKLGIIGLAYLVMRVAGKTIGSYFGAIISKAPETVRRYLGFGLLSQAGVAIGLAIDALHTFRAYGGEGAHIGLLAINVIAATTFVYQVLGPPCTKFAIVKAGEVPEEYLT